MKKIAVLLLIFSIAIFGVSETKIFNEVGTKIFNEGPDVVNYESGTFKKLNIVPNTIIVDDGAPI